MTTTLERAMISINRAAEYFSVKELEAQTGRGRSEFASVCLKELVDNALDACEAAGVAPEIDIQVARGADCVGLVVADNGPGLTPETVARILDFDTRTSTNAAYRAPTRGAQGNALKTVIGIPVALGSEWPVVIEARGVRHEITARVDAAGNVDVRHAQTESLRTVGTRVAVILPGAWHDFDARRWARGFALVNPHALVNVLVDDGGEHMLTRRARTRAKRPNLTYRASRAGTAGRSGSRRTQRRHTGTPLPTFESWSTGTWPRPARGGRLTCRWGDSSAPSKA